MKNKSYETKKLLLMLLLLTCPLLALAQSIKKYNPYFSAAYSADGKDYDAHFDLLPIPLSAIQANKDGLLEQNPGY